MNSAKDKLADEEEECLEDEDPFSCVQQADDDNIILYFLNSNFSISCSLALLPI